LGEKPTEEKKRHEIIVPLFVDGKLFMPFVLNPTKLK